MPDDVLTAAMLDKALIDLEGQMAEPLVWPRSPVGCRTYVLYIRRKSKKWRRAFAREAKLLRRGRLHKARLERWYRNVR